MAAKQFSVIVAPSDGRKSFHFQISLWTVVAVSLLFLLIGTGFVFMFATYSSLSRKVGENEELAARCAVLEEKTEEIALLQEELEELRAMDIRVRKLVGLPDAAVPRGKNGVGPAGGESDPPDGVESVVLPDPQMPDESKRTALEEDLRAKRHTLPWPVEGFISSSFAEKRGAGGVHPGIDIAAPRNTLIEAPLSGTVSEAGWHPVYGYLAVLDHGDGLVTVYGHNAKLVVRKGGRVRKGDAIAFLGSTGVSSAPHLHFEARLDGYAVDPLFLLRPKENS